MWSERQLWASEGQKACCATDSRGGVVVGMGRQCRATVKRSAESESESRVRGISRGGGLQAGRQTRTGIANCFVAQAQEGHAYSIERVKEDGMERKEGGGEEHNAPRAPLGPKWGGQLCCFGGRKVGWGGASSAGCRLPLPNTRTKHQAPSTPTPRDTRDPPPGKFQFHFLPIQSHISRTRTTIAPPRGTCHDLIKTPIYQHRPTFYPLRIPSSSLFLMHLNV